jgi:hypothetical protein
MNLSLTKSNLHFELTPVTLRWRAGLSSSLVARLNKSRSPRVLLVPRRRTTESMFSLIWLNWRVSEVFANEIHWFKEFGRAHPSSLVVWFQRERVEALLTVNIMEHVLVPWCWRRMSWMLRYEDLHWWFESWRWWGTGLVIRDLKKRHASFKEHIIPFSIILLFFGCVHP